MKLKQDKEDFELSLFFQVSTATVSRIDITWINFIFFFSTEGITYVAS